MHLNISDHDHTEERRIEVAVALRLSHDLVLPLAPEPTSAPAHAPLPIVKSNLLCWIAHISAHLPWPLIVKYRSAS